MNDSTGCMTVLVMMLITLLLGAVAGSKYKSPKMTENQYLVEQGHAYYHPQTGEFTLKECKE